MKIDNYRVIFSSTKEPVLKINCKRVKARDLNDTLKSGLHGGAVAATGYAAIIKFLREEF